MDRQLLRDKTTNQLLVATHTSRRLTDDEVVQSRQFWDPVIQTCLVVWPR